MRQKIPKIVGLLITIIGSAAFYGCYGFTGNLIIPNSITSIGPSIFYDCYGLTGDLIIPNSVPSIGMFAFKNCHSFISLHIYSNNPFYQMSSFNSCAFQEIYYFESEQPENCPLFLSLITPTTIVHGEESYTFPNICGYPFQILSTSIINSPSICIPNY